MKKEICLNMKNEIFKGNVLDIGVENKGIVYSVYKQCNNNINIDYIIGKEEESHIKNNFYDICILFFSFRSIWFKINKKSFIKDICRYLNEEGLIYIWDIDKGYSKVFHGIIKILAPEKKIKKMRITDLNIFKDNSKENTVNLLKKYFDIIEFRSYDGVYYIKAKKKNSQEGNEEKNESSINSA